VIKTSVLSWFERHCSSEIFVGDEFISTAKREINTPIERELDINLQFTLDCII
jgi:hypothetical protein